MGILANNRLSWTGLSGTNALAYNEHSNITIVKRCVPEKVIVYKLFAIKNVRMTIKMEMPSWVRKKLVDLFLKRINWLSRSGFSSIKSICNITLG